MKPSLYPVTVANLMNGPSLILMSLDYKGEPPR